MRAIWRRTALALSVLFLAGTLAQLGALRSGPTPAQAEDAAGTASSPAQETANTWADRAAAAAIGTASVSVMAPPAAVELDEVFTVSVLASEVDDPLSGFQFDLAYDPDIITYLKAEKGGFLGSTDRHVVCPQPAKGTGTVRLACASAGSAEGASGDGTLAVLTFRASGPGESDLALSNVLLPDGGRPPSLMTVTTLDHSVTVLGEQLFVYLPTVLRDYTPSAPAALPDQAGGGP